MQTLGRAFFCYTRDVANEEALFRRRLREIVIQKYGSLDRFYLETDFSKGHLSQILRGKRSPSLATIVKLARALDVQVGDLREAAKDETVISPLFEPVHARWPRPQGRGPVKLKTPVPISRLIMSH